MTKTHAVADLIEDFSLYPRKRVDDTHVANLASAIQSGAQLPPIVVCAKSLRIVDGFHRTRAYRRVYGDDYKVECEANIYKDDAALFLDAMRRNANHGVALCAHDRAHCLLVSQRLGIADPDICSALNATPVILAGIRAHSFGKLSGKPRNSASAADMAVVLKASVQHMAGKTLTKPQVDAMPFLSGMRQAFHANQLIRLIETGMLDTGNEALMARLQVLRDALDKVLVEAVA